MTTFTTSPSRPAPFEHADAHHVTPYLLVGGDLDVDTGVAVEQVVESSSTPVSRTCSTSASSAMTS